MQTISYPHLALSFLPVAVVLAILFHWKIAVGKTLTAVARMLVQLLAVGYVLTSIFESKQATLIVAVLTLMIAAASWISSRPSGARSRSALSEGIRSNCPGRYRYARPDHSGRTR